MITVLMLFIPSSIWYLCLCLHKRKTAETCESISE